MNMMNIRRGKYIIRGLEGLMQSVPIKGAVW